MIRDYNQLETLDLSGNILGNHGARDIAAMIEENNTIKVLKLYDCQIGTHGLQEICSALCRKGNENLEYLDISKNLVPDKHLKMLLVLMYKNRNIQNMEYSLIQDSNRQRKIDYLRMVNEDKMDPYEAAEKMHGHHHEHYKCWEYALVFPWLWKSFIHAKHEAFAFKYDPEIMRLLED